MAADVEPMLTAHQMRYAKMVAYGWTNKRIASELGVSNFTVKGMLERITSKLGLCSRWELMALAYARGWVSQAEVARQIEPCAARMREINRELAGDLP